MKFGFILAVASLMGQIVLAEPIMTKQRMYSEIDTVANIFRTTYAPKEWKAKYAGWSIEEEATRAKARIEEMANPKVSDLRQIIKDMVLTTQDYHVSISFYATEVATLPFTIKGAEGRYFIVNIDRKKLPTSAFPFDVGDEVLSFNGQSIEHVIFGIKVENSNNVKDTDQSLAELMLTRRRASRGLKVPQGPVSIEIRPRFAQASTNVQLIWDYKTESVSDSAVDSSNRFKSLKKKSMRSSFTEINGKDKTDNPFNLGNRTSYLPKLGTAIWEGPTDTEFPAYIFKDSKNRLIGYVRIPSYSPEDKKYEQHMTEFAAVIKHFEAVTDAMVIDQINNPGGSVFYLYALVSMLTTNSIQAPQHRVSIEQGAAADAAKTLEEISKITNDAEAQEAYGKTQSGYPVTYAFNLFMKQFYTFISSEWNAGKTFSGPTFLYGVDHINPSLVTKYSKPILLLVNELDFSGGDFFPAILQDAKRVTVMGTRTAGAGGYVEEVKYPNQAGIEAIHLTGSIAERVSLNPIENLGVTPDIPYAISVEDLRGGFQEYKKAVLKAVEGL